MCLYPKLILNKKYTANKKNNYKVPEIKDEKLKGQDVSFNEDCYVHEWECQ